MSKFTAWFDRDMGAADSDGGFPLMLAAVTRQGAVRESQVFLIRTPILGWCSGFRIFSDASGLLIHEERLAIC